MLKRIKGAFRGASIAIGLSALYFLGSAAVSAAFQPPDFSYAMIKGISGDSTTVKGAFDISNLNFKTSVPAVPSSESSGALIESKTTLSPITFFKNYSPVTVELLHILSMGQKVTGNIYSTKTFPGGDQPIIGSDLQFVGMLSADSMADNGETITITPFQEKVTYHAISDGPLPGGLPEAAVAGVFPLLGVAGLVIAALAKRKKANKVVRTE